MDGIECSKWFTNNSIAFAKWKIQLCINGEIFCVIEMHENWIKKIHDQLNLIRLMSFNPV